jgi:6-phosphogluconolactonase
MPASMAYLAHSVDGKFLFSASYDGSLACVYQIEPNGCLASACLQKVATPPKAHCILPAPFGNFVYLTSVDADTVHIFQWHEKTHQLHELVSLRCQLKPGSGPRHLVFHPQLAHLYCINEHDGSLAVFAVDQNTGALTQLQNTALMPLEFQGNALASDIHLTPDGSYLYASVRSTNSIYALRVDIKTGLIEKMGVFASRTKSKGFQIDPKWEIFSLRRPRI